MRIPTIQGIIKRRILVNYRADADAIRHILPEEFRPKLHQGKAIAGICLIRLEHIRPNFAPEFIGISSENAAHRIAVEWTEESGAIREGVYIPRRDTDSTLNHLAGGRLFPGEHHKADFKVEEVGNQIEFAMQSADGKVKVKLKGNLAADIPEDSVFTSLAEASGFFEPASLGYSATKSGDHLDGIKLEIKDWKVEPLKIDSVASSYYDDTGIFPPGSIEFDHALLMRNITHEWHSAPGFALNRSFV